MSEDLVMRFIGMDLLSNIANNVGQSIDRLANRIDGLGDKHARIMAQMAQASITAGIAMVGVGAAIGGLMTEAAMAAARYEQSLILIHTQAGASTLEVGEMRQKIMDIGVAAGFGPQKVVDALYQIESVGLRGAEALKVLEAATKGARIGNADLEGVTAALSMIMASHMKGAKDASGAMVEYAHAADGAKQAMSLLDAIVGIGRMRMEDLATSFRSGIIGSAETFGVSLQEVGAGLALQTDLGNSATNAMTRLRMSLNLIGAPSNAAADKLVALGLAESDAKEDINQMTEAFKEHGMSVTQLTADLTHGGLLYTLDQLKKRMTDLHLSTDQQAVFISRAFGGGRSGAAIQQMFQNLDRLHQRFDMLNLLAGNFDERWQYTLQHNPALAVEILQAAIGRLNVVLGEALLPVLAATVAHLMPIITAIQNWIEGHMELIATFGPFIALAFTATGIVLLLAGAFLAVTVAIGAIAPFVPWILGFVALIGLLGGVVALVKNHWADLAVLWDNRVRPAAEFLWTKIQALWAILQHGWEVAMPTIKTAFDNLGTSILAHGGMWDTMTNGLTGLIKAMTQFLQSQAFAYFLAAFIVLIPHSIQISIDYLAVFIASLNMTMREMAVIVKVAVDIAGKHWERAESDLKAGWADLADAGKVEADALKKAWEDSTGDAAAKTLRDFNDMAGYIHSALNPVPADVSDVMDRMDARIESALSREKAAAYEASYGIGSNIGSGIEHGILGKIGNMSGAVEFAVDDAMRAGRNRLASSSPSRLSARLLGAPISEGIAMGITDKSHLPAKAVQEAVTAAMVPVPRASGEPALSPLPPRSGPADTTNYEFHNHVYLSGDEIRHEVKRQTSKELNRLLQ